MSKNSAKCRIPICNLLQSRDFESHSLFPQPLKLNNRQTLVTNKAATYANNWQCDSAPNINRVNFAINNLEYNKLKPSTLTLHVTACKA